MKNKQFQATIVALRSLETPNFILWAHKTPTPGLFNKLVYQNFSYDIQICQN